MATLQDIAQEVGVSAMTVSRALRGVGRIGPETRQRVRKVAMRLGYQPISGVVIPPPVRRGKADHALRLILPTISRQLTPDISWFTDRMIDGLRQRLEVSNGSMDIEHYETLEQLVRAVRKGRYHGVVLRQPIPDAWVRRIQKLRPVLYAVEFDHQLAVDSVYSNEHRSAAMIQDHLAKLGHRNVAWFGILDRYAPYQVIFDTDDGATAADRQGITVHGPRHAAWANIVFAQLTRHTQSLVLVERDWRTQSLDAVVRTGLERILATQPRPTAVVTSCDPVGALLVDQLAARGLSVPKDMSVISYGGSDIARKHKPPLDSLEMPMETIGRVIPELIERRLADPDAIPVSMQFETKLCAGETVGRCSSSKHF